MHQLTKQIILYSSAIVIAGYQTPALALNWTLRPNLDVQQIYSDNIRLSERNIESALVTEITPGVSIKGDSSRGSFDLDYNLQAIYNAYGSSKVDIYNQLQMESQYEFVRNRLFVESSSSISQQNTSNRRISNDNISGDGDSTTVSTFMLSPYWTPHFQGFADGEFRLTYDRVSTSDDESSSSSRGRGERNSLSDTNSFSQNIFLSSGKKFSLISWSVSFNNSLRKNKGAEEIRFQNSQFETRYAIGREFSIFARAGHSSNSFSSNSNNSNNGISYTFGGQWEPSQRFRIEAGYGNNKFITVEISPFNRLHWITTYSNNDIGLNTGSSWLTDLNYNTRRSTWSVKYIEETTTTQQVLLEQQVFNNSAQFSRNTRLPSLTDEVFITKTADISFSFETGKSTINASAYKTIREYELSQDDEEVTGLSAGWNWQFLRRTSSNLQLGWQKTESDGIDNFSDKRFNFSLSLERNILSHLNGSIEYRYVDQTSDSDSNNYSENRITANLSLQF